MESKVILVLTSRSPIRLLILKFKGRFFALSGVDASNSDNLIIGTSFINGIPLVTFIDTGDTHSFIYVDCLKRFNLEVSSMNGRMVIDTSNNGSVTTMIICLRCLMTVYGMDFIIDLVCLPLSRLNIILGMNWLALNHVYINFYNKYVLFPYFVTEEDSMFIFASQVEKFLKGEEKVFAMFASLKFETGEVVGNLRVVCDILDVFPDDISDLPPEREVKFSIDLIPDTISVSMTPYKMSPSELSELKK